LKNTLSEFILIGFAALIVLICILKSNKRYLRRHGIPGKAKILSIEKTGFNRGGGSYSIPVMQVALEIENIDTYDNEVVIETTFARGKVPKVDDIVNILIDPKNLNNLIII
jgi:hypothetical protein